MQAMHGFEFRAALSLMRQALTGCSRVGEYRVASDIWNLNRAKNGGEWGNLSERFIRCQRFV